MRQFALEGYKIDPLHFLNWNSLFHIFERIRDAMTMRNINLLFTLQFFIYLQLINVTS